MERLQVGKHGPVRRETHLSSTGTERPELDPPRLRHCIQSSVHFIMPFPKLADLFPELREML